MIAMVVLLAACSNKTNTARSRFWQSFTTKYNVYFHGKTNYDEQEKTMLESYNDDYTQRLFMHPAEARANPKVTQPSGSFERTIEKMEKAITLHSIKKKPKRKNGKGRDPKYQEWMSRDEYNPFLHNAWYILAKSQYLKGDFLDAAATFRYIARHFTWKQDLVQECQVREALCYCAMGWPNEAENVLSHVHMDEITNKKVRALANVAFADYYIKAENTEQAIPYLEQAIKGFKGNEQVRMNFLLGQLYEEIGDKHNAYLAFKQAGSSSGSTYRTKFNARIKQSAVYEGANIASEVKALKRMTRYDRNKEYLDQIYYAIGNLYLSHGDTLTAIENYRLAAKKSTQNGVEKAISQLTLGGIYFDRRQYDEAQVCYSEAIPLIKEDYPNYKMLKKRSDVLDELAVYAQNVALQDSLLRLAAMTPEEQKAVIAKIIEELKKKEKEEAEERAREEYLAKQDAKGDRIRDSRGNAPANYTMNTDNSWYFYNNSVKQAGKTEFQKLWGSRKLEDNWRRRNKSTFSFGDEEADSAWLALADSVIVDENGDTVQVDIEALKRAEDPHNEEFYLKQIPKTEEEIASAHEVIQEGLYNMGTILKDKMEDYDAAAYEYNQLLRLYPDNTYRLDVFYSMYMMYMRNGQVADAEPYRDSILINFPDSKYGIAMQDPNYLENLKNMNRDQENMYEAAYANYLANNHQGVHDAYAEMMRKYPLSKIMPKFMFIDALSYLTEKDHEKFKETIKDMLQRYPQTDITPVASEIVKQLNQGRRLEGGGSNVRGMLWTTRLSNDTTPQALERTFTPFAEDNDKPQVFILLYPMDSVNGNMLLYEVARHNFNSFKVKDYDIEQMNFGTLGLLVVKGMDNFKEAINYRTLFEQDQTINVPRQVHYVIISVDNFNLLLNEGRTFEDYFNYLEEKNDKEHSDLEKKELDEAEKKAAVEREKARLEAEQLEREAAEQARLDAEAKALEEAEEQARLEAEAAEQARIEAEEQARQEAERKKIQASDYRNRSNQTSTTTQTTLTEKERKAQEKAEEEHLKQLEREAKAREKAEGKRQKEIEDSIKKEQKHQRKLDRIAEIAEQDSIEQAEKEKEKERDFLYKWREDSARAAYKAAEQAKKDAKKAKEQARKDKAKERKQQAKEREKERKEKAKQRERERKEKVKERKEQAKERERERKERAKERERDRKDKAEQRKQDAKDKAEQRKQDAKDKADQRKQDAKDKADQRKQDAKDKKANDDNSVSPGNPDSPGDPNAPNPNKKKND